MNLPTEEQCFGYFEQYKVPKNIFEHCLKVRKVAVFLAKQLKKAGVDINIQMVCRIAFLHDLFKMIVVDDLESGAKHFNYVYSTEEVDMWRLLREKYLGMHECEVAFVVFKDEFPELALAIRNASDPLEENKSIEQNVTHYADWRVANNDIVSLRERVDELKARYVRGEAYWEKRVKLIFDEEKKIFSYLNFKPEDLRSKIV